MEGPDSEKPFDLEARTEQFAARVRALIRSLPRTLSNVDDAHQLVRASGSVGANYIEAREALSKKDFRMRIRITRKESKESGYWLRLIDTGKIPAVEAERVRLNQESLELVRIMTAILKKCE